MSCKSYHLQATNLPLELYHKILSFYFHSLGISISSTKAMWFLFMGEVLEVGYENSFIS